MASATSFKVQCPSCEAMVPVRDQKLIGRKIDCPKCKYRFLVEEPETSPDDFDVEDEAPKKKKRRSAKGAAVSGKKNMKPGMRRGEEDDDNPDPRRKKKEEGGNSKVMVLGLAGLVVALLGVGAFLVFGGDGKDDNASAGNNNGGGGGGSFGGNSGAGGGTGVDGGGAGGGAGFVGGGANGNGGGLPGTGGKESTVDITNLLPNDTKMVAHVNMYPKKGNSVYTSALRSSLFETPGAFDQRQFNARFGFRVEDVSHLVLAGDPPDDQGRREGWAFAVIRTKVDLDLKELKGRLKTNEEALKIGKHEYYEVKENLDGFSLFLLRGMRPKTPAFHIYDNRTLVLADKAKLEEFLHSDRKFTELSKPTKVGPPPGQKPPGGTPPGTFAGGAGGTPPGTFAGGAGGDPASAGGMAGGPPGAFGGGAGGDPASGGMAGGPPGAFGGGMAGGPPTGAFGGGDPASAGGMAGGPPPGAFGGMAGNAGNAGFTGGTPGGGGSKPPQKKVLASFLTVPQKLKTMMDALKFEQQIVAVVVDGRLAKKMSEMMPDVGKLNDATKDLKIPGFTVSSLNNVDTGGYAMEAFSDQSLNETIGVGLRNVAFARKIRDQLKTAATLVIKPMLKKQLGVDVDFAGRGGQGNGGNNFRGGTPGTFQGGPPPGTFQGGTPPGAFNGVGGGDPAGGGGTVPPGGVPPGAFQGGVGGGDPAGGGGTVPPGGIPPGAFQGMGGGFPAGGNQGGFPAAGNQGGFPAAGNQGGAGMGGGRPTAPASSHFDLQGKDEIILFTLDLKKIPEKLAKQLKEERDKLIVSFHGQSVMANHRSQVHKLGEILRKYSEAQNRFPQGARARTISPDQPLDWAPNQRVSWMLDLLPHMGASYAQMALPVRDGGYFNVNRSWDEGENLKLAGTLVPYFLAANDEQNRYGSDSWQFEAGKKGKLINTHFVGVAGLGMDAATYEKDDASVAKKLGVFGYDRSTNLTEIKDGLENTIAVLQVPPTYASCWLAGGGSTVRGVDEENPLRQFICVEYNGKMGTFAIMADGRVRFIAADINPATFKAMCTIAGGEKIADLDKVAPLVPRPGNDVVLEGGGVGGPKKPPVKKPTPRPLPRPGIRPGTTPRLPRGS